MYRDAIAALKDMGSGIFADGQKSFTVSQAAKCAIVLAKHGKSGSTFVLADFTT